MKGETYTAQVVDELTALAASERSRADRLEQDLERVKTQRDELAEHAQVVLDALNGLVWLDGTDEDSRHAAALDRLLASVEENP